MSHLATLALTSCLLYAGNFGKAGSATTNVGPHTTGGVVATSVAGNVSSFLSGIRASFRTDNIYVGTESRSRIGNSQNNNSK